MTSPGNVAPPVSEHKRSDLRGDLPQMPDDDDITIPAKRWCSAVMIPVAWFMCMVPLSFQAQPYKQGELAYNWFVFATIFAVVAPFILLKRADYPEVVFWVSCAIVLIFPYDPMLSLMALASLLARRTSRVVLVRSVAACAAVAVVAQVRDAVHPIGASAWGVLFTRQATGVNGEPPVAGASHTAIIVTAVIVALLSVAVATLVGLYIRSNAQKRLAKGVAADAQSHAQDLLNNLSNQQVADAVAAEAHDTLAHSLSLIALNASALQTQTSKLAEQVDMPPEALEQEKSIEHTADDIRRQAAGALDEAHNIIGMLRHPEQILPSLTAGEETSLTRESLEALIAEARGAGTQINTWIDVSDLTRLDPNIAKIAYRGIQESLTNARRHAPGSEVWLEVNVSPSSGVNVHVVNPVSSSGQEQAHKPGSGLHSLAARAQAVGGQCRFGVDERGMFHVDVRLPFRLGLPRQ